MMFSIVLGIILRELGLNIDMCLILVSVFYLCPKHIVFPRYLILVSVFDMCNDVLDF